MKISIIIPNYNGEVLLRKNIPRLLRVFETYAKKTNNIIEVIVVDDYSTDKSCAVVRDQFQKFSKSQLKLTLLTSEKNGGFSKTVNRGASHATGEILVLLNTDVYAEGDFLTPALKHFSDESLFAVGFMDQSIESGETVLRGRGIGKWERGFLLHKRGEIDSEKTLWVNGGSGAFRKIMWDRLSGMDELFTPFYWEDIDLSYRALKAGYKLIFEKKSVVVHEHEKGAIAKTYTKSQVKTIAYRNQILFTWLNATDLYLIFSHIVWLPIHIFKALLNGDNNFLIGLFRAFILLPKIIQSRNRRKNHTKSSDFDVMQEFIE